MEQTAVQAAPLRPIAEVAADIGIDAGRLYPIGPHIAKIRGAPPPRRGKLVLVTALTPTPAGEGKTTMAIGLVQGLRRIGKRAAVALREPSLGPLFGRKGGATGGGMARVLPEEDINLHFTGDIHAVGAATNLLAALADNHLHRGNALGLDPGRIGLKRALDINDRSLRHVAIGLGGRSNGVTREAGFELTVASEIMAILALARDLADLKERLAAIEVGRSYDRRPVTARDLKAPGALAALLLRALEPNLVQTSEGQPAFIHLGPFANIAHGTNSVLATRMALGHAEVVVTEAGFASDLGAEKFFNVVARQPDLAPDAVVLVATLRALRHHGGADDPLAPDPDAVGRGLANLDKHVENIRLHGLTPVIALNRFEGDSDAEIERLATFAAARNLPFAPCEAFARGGEGALELAAAVQERLAAGETLHHLYELDLPLAAKIERIADRIYGAAGVDYSPAAARALRTLEREGGGRLPVVVAKTPASLSDDPSLPNRPRDFTVRVTDLEPRWGAGFVVAFMGDILTLPGLPARPAAEAVDVTDDGRIVGLS